MKAILRYYGAKWSIAGWVEIGLCTTKIKIARGAWEEAQ